VKAELGADGKLRRVGASGKPGRVLKGRTSPALLDSPAAFTPDADTPVLTRRQLGELRPVNAAETPDLPALRHRLHLSQGAFAALYGIPLATVKDWEHGRRKPDAPARAYLRAIAYAPNVVRDALQAAE
jgi:putative transcriptional regulator